MRNHVQRRIQRAVQKWTVSAEQRCQINDALVRNGFPLNPDARMRVGALSAAAYRIASGPHPLGEADAAAITELYIAASFLLDDVMDEEIPTDSSTGVETALGTTVLLIADSALDDAMRYLPAGSRFKLKAEAHRLLLTACAGQLQELLIVGKLDQVIQLDLDEAMALTERKAGSLGELAGLIGAGIAAGADADVTAMVRRAYHHFFTYIQIIDDLSDAATPATASQASDITKGRPTVPAVFYFRTQVDLGANPEDSHQGARHIIDMDSRAHEPDIDELRITGTTLFTQIVAEIQRNRAVALAKQIQQQYGNAQDLLTMFGEEPREHKESQQTAARTPIGATTR